jgi:hypothetical protein
MTQPNQYRLGAIAFVGMCLVVYALIAYFHKELMPIVGIVAPELYATIQTSMTDGSLAYPVVVIFAAALFVAALKIEKDWNPLLVLRRVVHGWVSSPQFANALMVMARDELVVPADARAMVAADPDTPYVSIGDFEKDRRSDAGPNFAISGFGWSTIAPRARTSRSSTSPVSPGTSCRTTTRRRATASGR